MNLFDLSYNREKAILIYNGKIYESEDNHQYALEIALKDNEDCLENYLEDKYSDYEKNFIERNIEELIEYTDSKSFKNELFTFDNFDNKYLLAHYKSNLDLNFELLKDYANKNKLQLGYFTNIDKYDVEIL